MVFFNNTLASSRSLETDRVTSYDLDDFKMLFFCNLFGGGRAGRGGGMDADDDINGDVELEVGEINDVGRFKLTELEVFELDPDSS